MKTFTPEWIREYRAILEGRENKYDWNNIVALECLDEIERLQARVQELEQERRWIPVSERLPEDSRIYDVAIADYNYSWTGTCVFGKWIGESGKAILGVTHWKYRPQLPKESEGE